MEQRFIVSARKYRPATFDTVVGQSHITTTLKNAIRSNHLAQAFLFCGPRGVGKTTCARILAKTINCHNVSADTEACDQCESCVSFNNNASLNIYELDAASNNSVDDIRGLVEQVRFAPQGGKYKVYIIDEVHMLSASAFNAFLKTLEEPPSYAIFILATTEKHKIIPTILSRCQIFDFSRIQVDDITDHLASIAQKENITAEVDGLHIIAQKADGALRDSLSMFDQIVTFTGGNITYKAVIENLNVLDYDYYFRITDYLLKGKLADILLVYSEIIDNGFDGHNFVNGLCGHFRDLMVCKDEVTLKLLEVSPAIKEKYREQSKASAISVLLQCLDIANKCDTSYKTAKNARLHVELMLMKLCAIGNNSLLGGIIEDHSKKKLDTPSLPEVTIAAEAPKANYNTTTAPSINSEQKVPPSEALPIPNPAPKRQVLNAIPRTTKSISGVISGNGASNKDEQKQNSPINPENLSAFTPEQFENVWNTYAQQVANDGKMQLNSTLIRHKPVINGTHITFMVDNKVQAESMSTEKFELLAFLRKELKNDAISLTIEIMKAEEVSSRPYTDIEKLKRMIEKNPNVADLKDRLGLDIV